MSQFTLQWDNSSVLNNNNAIGQRASYRSRTVGGDYIATGFSPNNDLAKSAITTDTPVLLDNVVYQFKVETLCTVNGPTINDNDIQEAISFNCISPNITVTTTHAEFNLDVTGTDIIKIRVVTRRASDSVIIDTSISTRISNNVYYQVYDPLKVSTLLTPGTNYYFQIELYALVNNVEVKSSSVQFLGETCSPYPFTTLTPPVCDPLTSITVTSIQTA